MALENYEAFEVAGRLMQRIADALKNDNKVSKSEALKIVVETVTDLGGEIIDEEASLKENKYPMA